MMRHPERTHSMYFLRWMTIPLILLSASCAVFAPGDRTDVPDDVPPSFSRYTTGESNQQNRWWSDLGSDELDRLVQEALTNSPSIRQAWARLDQAEAIARRTGAGRYPELGYEGRAAASRNSITDTTTETYSLGLAAAYEVDLWGRVKSQAQAAAFDRDASREQLNAAAITLASRVALTWSAILSQRQQTDLLERQLKSNRTSLELIELRFRNSLATALAVYQQRQTVAATEARIPLAQLREETLRNELAVLLGRADFDGLTIEQEDLPNMDEPPVVGLPAEILAQRPDVRSAARRLESADWSVSAARADLLPAIRLTASAEYRNGEFSDLLDDWYANLAAGLAGPIFEGGRRQAEVDRTRAVAEERLAAYRETVLNALKEVENALVSEYRQRTYLGKLDQRLEAARTTYEESVNRYRNGLVEYTTVLLQLNTLQSVEREVIEAQQTLLEYRIALYRALGGRWPEKLEQDQPLSTEDSHA